MKNQISYSSEVGGERYGWHLSSKKSMDRSGR